MNKESKNSNVSIRSETGFKVVNYYLAEYRLEKIGFELLGLTTYDLVEVEIPLLPGDIQSGQFSEMGKERIALKVESVILKRYSNFDRQIIINALKNFTKYVTFKTTTVNKGAK